MSSEPVTYYIREIRLETHSYYMSDWFQIDVETAAKNPVFHAVEQRSGAPTKAFVFRDYWGVIVLSDTDCWDRYAEPPAETHKHRLIFIKSRDGMAQAAGGAHKYLGSFMCEYGFRWFVFRALPEASRRAADGSRPSPSGQPLGSAPIDGSKTPRERKQSFGQSAQNSGGTSTGRGS